MPKSKKSSWNAFEGLWSKKKIMDVFGLTDTQMMNFANGAHRAGAKFIFRRVGRFETYYCDPGEIRKYWDSLPGDGAEKRARLENYGA